MTRNEGQTGRTVFLSSSLSMTLMATFSPVMRWRATLTLANPPVPTVSLTTAGQKVGGGEG